MAVFLACSAGGKAVTLPLLRRRSAAPDRFKAANCASCLFRCRLSACIFHQCAFLSPLPKSTIEESEALSLVERQIKRSPPDTAHKNPANTANSPSTHYDRRYDVGSELDHVSIRFPLRRLRQGIHPAAPHLGHRQRKSLDPLSGLRRHPRSPAGFKLLRGDLQKELTASLSSATASAKRGGRGSSRACFAVASQEFEAPFVGAS